jgi:hypothetical protein
VWRILLQQGKSDVHASFLHALLVSGFQFVAVSATGASGGIFIVMSAIARVQAERSLILLLLKCGESDGPRVNFCASASASTQENIQHEMQINRGDRRLNATNSNRRKQVPR